MPSYLLIESRDPFSVQDVRRTLELAGGLARDKNDVTLLFVENGVFAARESGFSPELATLAKSGVRLLADDFSLRERGIQRERVAAPVRASTLDIVIEYLEQGHKILWN